MKWAGAVMCFCKFSTLEAEARLCYTSKLMASLHYMVRP